MVEAVWEEIGAGGDSQVFQAGLSLEKASRSIIGHSYVGGFKFRFQPLMVLRPRESYLKVLASISSCIKREY